MEEQLRQLSSVHLQLCIDGQRYHHAHYYYQQSLIMWSRLTILLCIVSIVSLTVSMFLPDLSSTILSIMPFSSDSTSTITSILTVSSLILIYSITDQITTCRSLIPQYQQKLVELMDLRCTIEAMSITLRKSDINWVMKEWHLLNTSSLLTNKDYLEVAEWVISYYQPLQFTYIECC